MSDWKRILSLFSAIASLSACAPNARYDLVVNNVAVVDMDTGESAVRSIGVNGQRIETLSKAKLKGRLAIDGTGLWAIPGLWDMHVHISDRSFFDLFVENGVVGVRDMGGDATKPSDGCESINIETLHGWRAEIEAGERLGPRIVAAGPIATGNPGANHLLATTPESARGAVAEIVRRGGDFVKVYENIPPAAFRALADEARMRNLDFAGHVSEETLTIIEALEQGQRSIEHVRSHLLICFAESDAEMEAFYDADGWTDEDRLWGAKHRALCPEIWSRLRDGETWVTPTLAVEQTRYDGEKPGFENDARRAPLPVSIRSAVADFSERLRMRSNEERAEAEAWMPAQFAFVAKAKKEGAPMLAGSDAACEGVIPGYGLHDQLSLFVSAGLTPLEALRTATIEPAAYFRVSDKRGRINADYDADFLVLRADPMKDIRAAQQIAFVILRGRAIDR
ncbi:MAG: amidohydrolase family protein [Parvularculaceae bacterium]|nr:amidohydrolase family protein [Parvularculaceae bacterium]